MNTKVVLVLLMTIAAMLFIGVVALASPVVEPQSSGNARRTLEGDPDHFVDHSELRARRSLSSQPRVINVPADYPTIQEAIEAAEYGDSRC